MESAIPPPKTNVVYLPLLPPIVSTPVRVITLSLKEQEAFDFLLAYFNNDEYTLAIKAQPVSATGLSSYFFTTNIAKETIETRKLSDLEKCELSREALLRALRAENWDVEKSKKRLEATLLARRTQFDENGDFSEEEMKIIEREASSGKQLIYGYDKALRPIIIMIPKLKIEEKASYAQELFVIFTMERAIDLMPVGVETVTLLMDLDRTSPTTGLQVARAPLSQIKSVLSNVQQNYYERSGISILFQADRLFHFFFRLVEPFLDEKTAKKVHWNIDELIEPSNLQIEIFGGEVNFEYDHDIYFEALEKVCKGLRAEKMERFKALGGEVGISEILLKGGTIEELKKVAKAVELEP